MTINSIIESLKVNLFVHGLSAEELMKLDALSGVISEDLKSIGSQYEAAQLRVISERLNVKIQYSHDPHQSSLAEIQEEIHRDLQNVLEKYI